MTKVLPIAIFGLFLGGLAVIVTQAMAPRPGPGGGADVGGHAMGVPDLSKIAPGASIVRVTAPADLSPTARVGQQAFDAKCAACHGPNAAGRNGMGPPLVHAFYKPGHHADAAFLIAARGGVQAHHWPFGNMPPVEGVTPADVKAITAYVRSLQQANGVY
ncbi:c-type cytochrome [Acidimangrovimonas sediminis]|uniref:c-type cytochrome n=1 Tax=Acidimangrovimonas sediminis TaxID=2056283 RepID=UPI000C7FBB0E|nr:cytochrome c [Acidimangrovimonas sediminis]